MMRQQEFGIHSVSGDYEAPPWDHPAQLTEPTTFPWVMTDDDRDSDGDDGCFHYVWKDIKKFRTMS